MKREMRLHCIVKEESAWPKQFCSIAGNLIVCTAQWSARGSHKKVSF